VGSTVESAGAWGAGVHMGWERAHFEPRYETETSRQPDHYGSPEPYSEPDVRATSSLACLSCFLELMIVYRQICPASSPPHHTDLHVGAERDSKQVGFLIDIWGEIPNTRAAKECH